GVGTRHTGRSDANQSSSRLLSAPDPARATKALGHTAAIIWSGTNAPLALTPAERILTRFREIAKTHLGQPTRKPETRPGDQPRELLTDSHRLTRGDEGVWINRRPVIRTGSPFAQTLHAAVQRSLPEVAIRSGLDPDWVILRFGLHWGSKLFVGQVTTSGRAEVNALGDEVNETARIEACATGGLVLGSKDLLERLEDDDATA